MHHRTIILAAFLWGAIGLAGQARDAASKPAKALIQRDFNSGCDLPRSELLPWRHKGMALPASLASKFRLWKSIGSPEAPVPAGCRSMTPFKYVIKPPGEGGMSRAELVVAMDDVPIYRVFSRKPFRCGLPTLGIDFGAWWSLTKPSSKREYRRRNAICGSWNDLSMKIICVLKKGSVIAVGPTQSIAECPAGPDCTTRPTNWATSFSATNEAQVFLNTRGRKYQGDLDRFLIHCRTSPWSGRE